MLRTAIVTLLALFGAGGCMLPSPAGIRTLDERIVFQPQKSPADEAPQSAGMESVFFSSSDGTKLHGLYLRHPHPRAVVLYLHGNAGNLDTWSPALGRLFEQQRVTVLGVDYRGYGRSEGKPTENGVLRDARAARDWLAEREGIAPSDIVLLGRSLGGAIAVDLAAKDDARGLILESTFTSLRAAAQAHLASWAPSWALMPDRFDSLAKLPAFRGPLLESHGDADRVIPFEQGERLFAAASGSKRFVRIAGGDHNDPPTAEYEKALDEFLESLSHSPRLRS